MPRPQIAEYGTFFQRYIDYPSGDEAMEILENSIEPLKDFYGSIPQEKAGYAYAPGKWTVAQLLQHVIDTERIFAYRALCIARGEQQPLPGFEENDYAEHATAKHRTLEDLVEELLLVRQTTILLYKHLSNDDLFRVGTASNHAITPNAIAFILVGHAMHHQKILSERYLSAIGTAI